jgi:glycine/D-amino acid oxidase-like deaminating enzyme
VSAEFDVVIIGAGIAGISLAWHLNRKGKSVCVLEKSAQAEGASVRNFGMIWVIGQANEEIENLAGQSLEFWKEASSELGFWFKQSGSLHLAYHPLEWQVLQEYASSGRCCEGRKLLGASEVSSFSSQVKTDGLLGALYSPTEGCVDPRESCTAEQNG